MQAKMALRDVITPKHRTNPAHPYLYPRGRILVINDDCYMSFVSDLNEEVNHHAFPSFRLRGYISNFEDEVKKACLEQAGVVVDGVVQIVGEGIGSISHLTKYRQTTNEVELSQCVGYTDFWYVAKFKCALGQTDRDPSLGEVTRFWLPFNQMVTSVSKSVAEEELPSILLALLDAHKQFTGPKFP